MTAAVRSVPAGRDEAAIATGDAGPAAPGGGPAFAILLAVAGLYVSQSVITGLTYSALPAILRARGLALDHIGLIYLVIVPWVLKFLWAPAIDRYRLPVGAPTRSRQVVLAGGLVTVSGLVAAALIGPAAFWPLLAALGLVAAAAATVDIACDGHAVEALSRRHHGYANAAQVGGAYLGFALGSGAFLVAVARLDWTVATLGVAAVVVLGAAPFVLAPAPRSPRPAKHLPTIRGALARPDMRAGLALAALFAFAQKWGASMLGPYLVDAGLDLATIGIVNGIGGTLVGCLFALLAGAIVRAWHARGLMVAALALQGVTMAVLALVASRGGAPAAILVGLSLTASSALMALGFVALYAQFMALSDPRQAGVDFTLLQCMDACVSMAGGLGAGWIAEHGGYPAFFAIAAAGALVAAPLAGRLAGRLKP